MTEDQLLPIRELQAIPDFFIMYCDVKGINELLELQDEDYTPATAEEWVEFMADYKEECEIAVSDLLYEKFEEFREKKSTTQP